MVEIRAQLISFLSTLATTALVRLSCVKGFNSPNGSPAVQSAKPFSSFDACRTTELMIVATSVLDRQENATVQNQVDHCPLAFLAQQHQHLRPGRFFHGSYMAVWVHSMDARDVRWDVCMTVHRTRADVFPEALAQ